MRKTEVVSIKCSLETKLRWRNLLYEFKKGGYTAEELLNLGLDYVERHHLRGRVV